MLRLLLLGVLFYYKHFVLFTIVLVLCLCSCGIDVKRNQPTHYTLECCEVFEGDYGRVIYRDRVRTIDVSSYDDESIVIESIESLGYSCKRI